MIDSPLSAPQPLNKYHDIIDFDCGIQALNEYLKKYALQNQLSQGVKNYVVTRENKVVGYFSLVFGSVSFENAPNRLRQGLSHHPIPILLLARLAVDQREKGKGLGKALLKEALLKTIRASEIAGLRAILVHAKDNSAKTFYQHFGFQSFASEGFTLYLLIKDIRKNLNIECQISTFIAPIAVLDET